MISGDYIAGLIDGEGSFVIRMSKDKKARYKVRTQLCLTIHMSSIATQLLKDVHKTIKCGKLYYGNDFGALGIDVSLTIFGIKEINEKLIPFLDKHPPILKKDDYKIFKRAAKMLYNKEHQTREGIKELLRLRNRINIYTQHKNRKEVVIVW